MKKILRLIFVVLLLGGWALSALALHVVVTPDKLVVIPKNKLEVSDTFVDTRHWTLNDAAGHEQLVKRLISLGKTHALEHLADLKKGEDVEPQLTEALKRGPAAPPATTQPAMTSHNVKAGR